MTESELIEFLKRHLRVEVVNPDYSFWTGPEYPTVKVRILLMGETITEDEAPFSHNHGADT